MKSKGIKLTLLIALSALVGVQYAFSCYRMATVDCLWVCNSNPGCPGYPDGTYLSGSGQSPVTYASQQGQTGYLTTAAQNQRCDCVYQYTLGTGGTTTVTCPWDGALGTVNTSSTCTF